MVSGRNNFTTWLAAHWLLMSIVLIAGFFRLYSLSTVPPAASLDEVSIGYNAFSILKTGRDEYGTVLPILLRAYDDWRPALYVYLVIPFVWIFGLTAFAVRLPSFFCSMLTIVLTYGIVRMLFEKPIVSFARTQIYAAHVAAIMLAISPWHIYISRLGHEVNLGSVLTVLGIYFFLRSVFTQNRWLLIGSFVAFAIALYGYQSQKVIVPIIVASMAFCYRKYIVAHWKNAVIAIIAFVCILLPLIWASLAPDALVRFRSTSEFLSDNPKKVTMLSSYMDAQKTGNIFTRVRNSPKFFNIRLFISNYLSHFNPEWLLIGYPKDQHKAPGTGLLYPGVFVFSLIGMGGLIYQLRKKELAFLILWFLSSAVPAGITSGAPHAMRTFTFIPIWQIIAAYGFTLLCRVIRTGPLKKIFIMFMMIILAYESSGFYKNYFVDFPRLQSDSFQFALHKAIGFAILHEQEYDKIVISNEDNLFQSYMFYLFHSYYNPLVYIQDGGTKSGGFAESHTIGKYEFRSISKEEKFIPRVLYIADKSDLSSSMSSVAQFENLEGNVRIQASMVDL